MRRYEKFLALCMAFLTAASINVAAQIRLVADLNLNEESIVRQSKVISEHVAVGSRLFFTTDEESGQELWTSDGTSEGTYFVAHFVQIRELTSFGDALFFTAVTNEHGFELWTSNGTTPGTTLVKDIYPGGGSSNPTNLTAIGSTLFFSANNKANGRELWKSDGTGGGTTIVKDIRAGSLSSNVEKITAFGNSILFVSNDGATGYELWKSDGSSTGTTLVKDIFTTPGESSAPGEITVAGGLAFFSARSDSFDRQLFKSDGTTEGTSMVKVIRPGGYSAHIDRMTAVDNLVFFEAFDGVHGHELWRSDGTDSGTFMVKDLTPGPESNTGFTGEHIDNLAAISGKLFFTAVADFVPDLWVSDGTPGGTKIIASGYDLALYITEPSFAPLGNDALFVAVTVAGMSYDLYRSDGNTVTLVKQIGPLNIATTPRFALMNDQYYFFTTEDYWRTNGTATGTIREHSLLSRPGVLLSIMGDYNGSLLFGLEDFAPGGFWRTEGTPETTVKLKDIFARDEMVVHDGLAFFPAEASGPSYPWRSDGTTTGTFALSTEAMAPAELTPANGWMFFSAEGPGGRELYKTDGTAENTALVKDILPGPESSGPVALEALNNSLYFFAFTLENGNELWKSNGTDAGTTMVKDILPGPHGLEVRSMTKLGNTLFFVANDTIDGPELWRSDGTPGGTFMVTNIGSGIYDGSDIGTVVKTNTALFFPVVDDAGKLSIWKATQSEATKLRDLNGDALSDIRILTTTSNQVFFVLYLENDAELWRSNGTVTGTVSLKKFRGVSGCCVSESAAVRDGVVYFGLAHTVWRTDGTSIGTYALPFTGYARAFVTSGPYVYFHGYSSEFGRELFLIEPEGSSIAAGELLSVNEGPTGSKQMLAHPNPFRSTFIVRVDGETNETFSVDVIRPDGRTITTAEALPCNVDHAMGADWDDGVYIVRTRLWNTSSSIKMVKLAR
jgi:ELWxxDGT repeat protein